MKRAAVRFFAAAVLVGSGSAASAQEKIENWAAPLLWSPPGKALEKGDTDSGLAPEAVEAVPTPPLHFVGLTPCRLADTRGNGFTGQYGPPSLVAGVPRNFVLTGRCGISATAQAVSLNVTVTNTQGPGHIVIYPQGGAQATVSTLNYVAGQTIANAAVVPLGVGGGITVVAGVSGTDLILDTNGDYRGGVVTALNGLSGNVTLDSDFLSITAEGQTVFLDSGPGGALPAGTVNQTLRHNGTTWVPSSRLTNDGFNVTVDERLIFTGVVQIGTEEGELLQNGGGTGTNNTFVGLNAGLGGFLGQGTGNTGVGALALDHVNPGSANNTAIGMGALAAVGLTGSGNIAIGKSALAGLTTGSGNIAIGANVGTSISTGSNNLYIGSPNAGNESGQIRIGNNAIHTGGAVFTSIYGYGSVGGIPVIVNSGGRLGTSTSSARFKEDVQGIGTESDDLMKLRPVAFRYRESHEPGGLKQYGLIAEEVAEIYPELVVNDDQGRPFAIRSQLLEPLFLNELQKQRRNQEANEATISRQGETIARQQADIEELRAALARLEARIANK